MRAASVLGRIITGVLVFVLGFMSCIGAIVGGGYLAYSRLSLNKVGVDISGILSDKGEVDISSMTLQQLVAEITSIQGETWSIDLLVDRYGLILPEELDRFLSDEQKKKDLFSLLSADGIKGILDETYFGKLLGYEKKKNPAYNPLAPDEEPRTIWVNPDTDKKIVGINAVLSDITFGEFLDGGIPTKKITEELSIGDLMELEAKRDLPIFMENEAGELVKVENIDPIVIWMDEDGEEVATIIGALAEKHVDDLITGIDDISLSSVLGTVNYDEKTYTFERKTAPSEYILLTEAESIIAEFSDLSLNGLTGEQVTDKVNNVQVASLLGYTRNPETGKWEDKEGQELNSIMAQIAESKVGGINDRIDVLTYGEIAELVAVDENGKVIENAGEYEGKITWYKKGYVEGGTENRLASGVVASLAHLSLKDMSVEETLTEAVQDILVGDALGYILVEENGEEVWYEEYDGPDSLENKRASGIMEHVAGFLVGEMSTEVDKITFAQISGLKKVYYLEATKEVIDESELGNYAEDAVYFVWQDKDGNDASGLMAGLAHLTVKDLGDEDEVSKAVKSLAVGDAMRYKKVGEDWYKEYYGEEDERNVPLTGIIKAIADDKVGDMDERVKKVTLAEVAELIAVDAEGNVLENVDPKTYEGIWYEEYYEKGHKDNKPTTGLMAGLAHLTMEDLRSSSSIKKAVDKIATGDAMGYKKVDGVWYEKYYDEDDPQNKPLTGLVKNIADSLIMNLNSDIQNMRFGTVAGLVPVDASGSVIENADLATYTGTITWYEEGYVKGGSSNVEASGINAALANLTVENMANEAELSAAIQNVTVADAMNYTEVSEGKYEDKNHNEVTGFMAVIAPVRVENIKETLDEAQIGEFMGYKKDGSVWKAKGTADTWVAVDSLMQKVSEKKMRELDGLLNELVLSDVIETRTGLLALVDKPGEEPTKIKDLDKKLSAMFTKKTTEEGGITIGELKGKNLVPQSIDSHFDSHTFAAFMELAAEKVKAPTTNS